MNQRVVVIGGGITGLAAAYEVGRRAPEAEVILLEAGPRLGGKVLTSAIAGTAVDAGPDAFLARVPWAVDLCRELGLADDLVSPAARRAYVWSRGALRALPSAMVLGVPLDLDELAETGLVSPAGIDRARRDLDDSPHAKLRAVRSEDVRRGRVFGPAGGATDPDLSVGEVVRSRLGDEVLERVVDPLLGGINAGDSDRLSLEASAPQLAAAARRDASLIRGLQAERADLASDPDAPLFFTLPEGLGRLVDRLAEALTADVRLDTPVERIQRTSSGYEAVTPAGPLDADAFVVTTPAAVAAEQLAPVAPAAAADLAEIEYASVALVTFAVPEEAVRRDLDASGFLVPRIEGLALTACSWASSKWAHLQQDGQVLLRASAGRFGDDEALALDDDDLVERLLADLATTMDLQGRPSATRVSRWPASFPQYQPGHLSLVDRIERAAREEAPGVVVAGAALRGVGLPACIRQGREAAAQVVQR